MPAIGTWPETAISEKRTAQIGNTTIYENATYRSPRKLSQTWAVAVCRLRRKIPRKLDCTIMVPIGVIVSISKDELLSLVRAQSGHFVYESGYHSDAWWDLEALCHRPAALLPYVNVLATQVQEYKPEVVCGALVEGAFVALLTACNLHADFAYALRSGGDPNQMFSVSYHLPNALHDVVKGKRVVIANDVISAGSAVRGAIDDVQQRGGNVVAVASLVLLGNTFAEFCHARELPFISLFRQEFRMWLPKDCPLCAAGSIPDYLAHN